MIHKRKETSLGYFNIKYVLAGLFTNVIRLPGRRVQADRKAVFPLEHPIHILNRQDDLQVVDEIP